MLPQVKANFMCLFYPIPPSIVSPKKTIEETLYSQQRGGSPGAGGGGGGGEICMEAFYSLLLINCRISMCVKTNQQTKRFLLKSYCKPDSLCFWIVNISFKTMYGILADCSLSLKKGLPTNQYVKKCLHQNLHNCCQLDFFLKNCALSFLQILNYFCL